MIDWDECKSIRKQMAEMEVERICQDLDEEAAEKLREDMIRNSSGWYLLRRTPRRDHSAWWSGYAMGVLNAVFVAFLWWAWRVSG